MIHAEALSHAFIAAHPADAARVLEHLPPEASAALFASTPARVIAPTLRAMLPFTAAQAIATLPADAAAHLLAECGAGPTAAIVRYVPEARRASLIAALPTAMAVSVKLLLGFPASVVGAWIDTALPALPGHATAEVALERLRTATEEEVDLVHVVDPQQRLLGLVDLGTLLRAGGHVALAHLMRKAEHVLPVQATLLSVRNHPGWNQQLLLPVVERDGRLVGILRRSELMQALAHTQREPTARSPGEPLTALQALGAGYWLAVDGLVQSAIALLPTAAPLKYRQARRV